MGASALQLPSIVPARLTQWGLPMACVFAPDLGALYTYSIRAEDLFHPKIAG